MSIAYKGVIKFISEAFTLKRMDYSTAVEELQNLLRPWNSKSLLSHLKNIGIIPEEFEHDSTEEKLYSKYCDIVVAGFLEMHHFKTEVLEKRGDWPNIEARCKEYSLIADPKAFRASRTALNPKDFKIDTLGGRWRRLTKAGHAFLVSSRYPGSRSRIYPEAVGNNVTLLYFEDLYFIMSKYGGLLTHNQLLPLWTFPSSLPANVTGKEYWKRLRGLLRRLK